eukprot:COSAG01_NODE_11088_length_2010_cov_2.363161_4_plen_94_part_00
MGQPQMKPYGTSAVAEAFWYQSSGKRPLSRPWCGSGGGAVVGGSEVVREAASLALVRVAACCCRCFCGCGGMLILYGGGARTGAPPRRPAAVA